VISIQQLKPEIAQGSYLKIARHQRENCQLMTVNHWQEETGMFKSYAAHI
jgi:hypothetical protein